MMRILTSVFLLAISSATPAADWPQWRGPNRDCQIRSSVWPQSVDGDHLNKIWSLPLGPSYSGPIVVGNRVFITETRDESHEVVWALDRNTGDELWKVEWPGSTTVPFFARENGSWIRSTPASDGSRLYVAGILDILVCLDVGTGREIWRVDLAGEFNAARAGFGTVCSPLLDGEFIYLQAASSLVKMRKADGSVVWRTSPESGGLFGAGMGASAFSSPAIATLRGKRQIVVQTRQSLSGINPDNGNVLWATAVPAFRGMNILTPLINGDSVFTSSYGGGTFVFDVSANGKQFRVAERWKTNKQGYMSSPVLINGDIYLHLRNQRFSCIRPDTGQTRWTTRPFGKYWSMVVNQDQLLALDENGMLHLIQADANGFVGQSSRRVSDQETWAHLAVSDDQLFIRELNAISAWAWK